MAWLTVAVGRPPHHHPLIFAESRGQVSEAVLYTVKTYHPLRHFEFSNPTDTVREEKLRAFFTFCLLLVVERYLAFGAPSEILCCSSSCHILSNLPWLHASSIAVNFIWEFHYFEDRGTCVSEWRNYFIFIMRSERNMKSIVKNSAIPKTKTEQLRKWRPFQYWIFSGKLSEGTKVSQSPHLFRLRGRHQPPRR